VEEVATVHIDPPGAELPVRPQQEIKTEEPMIVIIEDTATYQAKVGHVFFLLTGVDAAAAHSGAELPRYGPEGASILGAIAKTCEARPEDTPQNAIARRRFFLIDESRSVALAESARFSRHAYGI
jgi:hypothetical protein